MPAKHHKKLKYLTKYFILMLFMILMCSGCATVDPNSFISVTTHQSQLPLKLLIDSNHYMNRALDYGYRAEISRNYMGMSGNSHKYMVMYQNRINTEKTSDAKYIISKSFEGLLVPDSFSGSTLTVNMTAIRTEKTCRACAILALALILPAGGYTAEVDLVATITKKNGTVIAEYTRTGRYTVWDSIWGYSDLGRGACAGAVADAAGLLVEDVSKDYTNLMGKLNN